jgi:hypothetical protein
MTNTKTVKQLYFPLAFIFIILSTILLVAQTALAKWGIEPVVVITGNLILFIATLCSLLLYQRAITHASTSGFLRNSYSGLMIKLFACLAAVFIYAMLTKGGINKPGIFACIFLYFIYTIIEMRSLMRWTKARTNA